MKLYKISQTVNAGYDTYSDAVVAAEDAEQARCIYPDKDYTYRDGKVYIKRDNGTERESYIARHEWTIPDNVLVEYIGEAAPDIQAGPICASYHAG